MLGVRRSISIRRPLAEVRAQFGDITYHERHGLHHGVRFRVLRDAVDGRCEYEQVTRIGPATLRQGFNLERADPAHQVNALINGPFAPGAITFDISRQGDNGTRVTATLTSQRRGLTSVAAPLLRAALARALDQSLDEDREDLESGSYAASRG